jgi:hypothetical protein
MCDRPALECGPVCGHEWRDDAAVGPSKCGGWFVAIYAKIELKKLGMIAVLCLAGCGVNGAPERPAKSDLTAGQATAGLTISGQAALGIAKNGN